MGIQVGIDLGTTYSAVARINPQTGKAEVIPNTEGGFLTPSVVAVLPGGAVLHGALAKEKQAEGYTETASFFKRCMGLEGYALPLCGSSYSAIDLSAMLLRGLVADAQQVAGEVIDSAVITVPAYFRSRERAATLQAGRQAGLNVQGLINEPTAAAFAYGLVGRPQRQTILVYDLGGGTFDVTLARITGDEIEILGSDGNHSLGGKNWDDAVAGWVVDRFAEETGLDLTGDEEQLAMLAVAAENAKKRLTAANTALIPVHYGGESCKLTLTRAEFDEITRFMLGETKNIIERMFASFKEPMGWQAVDGVVLVGGSTRMRQVHEYIRRESGREPLGGINVDEAVALGAAIRANQDANGQSAVSKALGPAGGGKLLGSKKITDATTHALGMISENSDRTAYVTDVLIPKNTAIPADRTLRRELRVGKNRTNELEVYLLQGDDPNPLNCDITGKYVFGPIAWVEGGKTLLDITYSYDENTVVQVGASQVETGTALACSRQPVPDDMSWVLRSPLENEPEPAPARGEIYLVIDLSGSMMGPPLEKAQQAMKNFVLKTNLESARIGIMGVADQTKVILLPTADARAIQKAIDSLQIGMCGGGNSTHPFDMLAKAYSAGVDFKYAVVLADGIWYDQPKAIQAAKSCHRREIEVIGMGFGSADEAFLRAISSRQDMAIFTNLDQLAGSFSKIARIIGENQGISRT